MKINILLFLILIFYIHSYIVIPFQEVEKDEIYNKENNRNKFNSDIDGDGVIIERIDKENNKINKIYVEQKDVNNILTECYEGLYSLKCAQDEFDNKYNILKNKLINKIKENNNNLGKRNIPDEDFNL